MRRSQSAALAFISAMLVAASCAYGGPAHSIGLSTCSSAVAGGPPLTSADPTFLHLGGEPFGVAATPGYALVANVGGFLDVVGDHHSSSHLIHKIDLRGQSLGVALTPDGRYLLMADGGDGAYVVDVARAETGARDALLGTLSHGTRGRLTGGAIEVATSRDGRYAFVSLEATNRIAVYRLAAAIATHFSKPSYVGAIPTGDAPVGLAVSPDGRWLYATSEYAAAPGGRGVRRVGSLSVISVKMAEHHPARAVVAATSAGCSPVRVAVSSNGQDVWVTARQSDELIAFSSSRLIAHAGQPELAHVRVGEAPVGLALVDQGTRIVVADSNRYAAAGRSSALTVVSTAAALAHRPAIIGTISAGLFPREMALEPTGTVLLIGNFGSGTLESAQVAALGRSPAAAGRNP